MQTIKKATHISTTRRLLPQFRILFLTVCKAVCKPALKFAAFPQGSGAGFLLYVVQANMIYAPRAEPFSRGKTLVKPLRVAASKGRIAPPENQHTFFFSHCLYFLSCTGQNCSDIITEAIQRHSARIEKADTPAPALQARRFSARFAVSYVCFAYSESFRTPPSVSQQRQRKGKAASSALLYHAAEKSARRSAQHQKSKNPARRGEIFRFSENDQKFTKSNAEKSHSMCSAATNCLRQRIRSHMPTRLSSINSVCPSAAPSYWLQFSGYWSEKTVGSIVPAAFLSGAPLSL